MLTFFSRARAADAEEDAASLPTPATPAPSDAGYLQYGVTFTGEFVLDSSFAGPMCGASKASDGSAAPCILGSGGGVAIRVGVRPSGPWYFGGAYELSKQDPNKLYRLAILQQVRAEVRYYFFPRYEVQPYASGGLGLGGYGNEWGVDAWGPAGFLAAGIETQISRRAVVGVALAYRPMYFGRFVDTSNTERPAGLANLIGFDLLLEARDPL